MEVVPSTQQEEDAAISLDDSNTQEFIYTSLPTTNSMRFKTAEKALKMKPNMVMLAGLHDSEDSNVDSPCYTPKRNPLTPLTNIIESMPSPLASYKGKKPMDIATKRAQGLKWVKRSSSKGHIDLENHSPTKLHERLKTVSLNKANADRSIPPEKQPSPKSEAKKASMFDQQKLSTPIVDVPAYWDWKETEVLINAKLLLEDAKEAGEVSKFLRKMESWNIVSSKCAENGVFRTWKQCVDRWNRVLKDFKTIYDYARNTPSGCNSYWATDSSELEPSDILVDTYDHVIGDGVAEGHDQTKIDENEEPPLKEQLSGHKRRRPGRVAEMLEGLEASNVKLVDVFAAAEERRSKMDQDLIEITREEYEAAKELNAKRLELERARLDNERDTNLALFKIASAIELFSSKPTHVKRGYLSLIG
ncbi:hypothetical protein L7F22_033812 [Adiantum nelumboides]|nr:hypothetical protein [Adiantum nelumboides]